MHHIVHGQTLGWAGFHRQALGSHMALSVELDIQDIKHLKKDPEDSDASLSF